MERGATVSSVWWAVAAAVVAFDVFVVLHPWDVPLDLLVFLRAARDLVATGDPWSAGEPPYAYPPVLAALMVPVAMLPDAPARVAWGVVDLVCAAVAVACAASACARPGRRPAGVVVAALLAGWLVYPPHLVGVTAGQVHTLVALLAVAPLALLLAGAEAAAGALIGLGAAVKLFPGLLAGLLVAPTRRRGLLGLAAALVVGVAPLATAWWRWATDVLPSASARLPFASQHVVSLPAVGTRLFVPTAYTTPVADAPWAGALVTVALLTALAAALARPLASAGLRDRWALLVVAMLLASPAVGLYHLDLALLAALVAYVDADGDRLRLRRTAGLGATVAGLVIGAIPADYGLGLPSPGTTSWDVLTWLHTGWGTLLMAPATYGLLLVLAGLVRGARAAEPTPRQAPSADFS